MSGVAFLGALTQIGPVAGVSLPILECPGPAFVHRHNANGTESYMEILDGSYEQMFSIETTINNAITPSGIRSIGFDAYTRYLYGMYAESVGDLVYKLGRIGYDSHNLEEFTVEYFDVTRPDDVRVALYGGDVFSPGGKDATEPGYYLAADHGKGYSYIKIADNLGVDEMTSVKMTDLGEERVQEFDIAFHPDSTDPTNAIFYSLDNIKEGGYDLIKFTANFETNEITSFNMGELHFGDISIPSFLFIEAVFFDDSGYLYFTTNNPSGHMLAVHVAIDATTTEEMVLYYLGPLETNWTTDGARCVGYKFPDQTTEVPTAANTTAGPTPSTEMNVPTSTSDTTETSTDLPGPIDSSTEIPDIYTTETTNDVTEVLTTSTEMPTRSSEISTTETTATTRYNTDSEISTTETTATTRYNTDSPFTSTVILELVSTSAPVGPSASSFENTETEVLPTKDGVSTTDGKGCGCIQECIINIDCYCPCYVPCPEDPCEDDGDIVLEIIASENDNVIVTIDAEYNTDQ